jgi:hypothetical protein
MTKKSTYAVAVSLLCLIISLHGFGQSVNAIVGGTISDASKALIPGVTVTATNAGTGIASTTVSNESGAYNFPALQPGTYKITAELPGFQTQTFTNVQLGGAQQVTLNFSLQVAAAAGTNVEVTVAADTVLATTSNSIGTVIPDYKLRDLPTLTGNVFNLVQNVPGVQRDGTGAFGYMAGQGLGSVNATRDGINVNDGRYENGAWSSVYTSPDMVEEVKVIVAPVDAETSRGNGQVQLLTRSGTNKYNGSLSWTNHNSALDANDWFNNRNGIGKSYDNRNLYSARLGGPIIKNKTFFFLLFTGQRDLKKVQAAGLTFTDMAKAGIFRYWPGVDNLNASQNNPSVDTFGNPVQPKNATGQLAAIGLFGSCSFNGAPVANCTPYTLDPNRKGISTNAFMQQEFNRMPSPNQFTSNGTLTGDGLNTAITRFVRVQDGLDQTNGNGDEVDRDQYNVRIDHNFNAKNRVSLIGTQEHTWGTAAQASLRAWPNAFDGQAVKRPVLYSIQWSSTLSNSMLNQVRVGKSGTDNWQWGAGDRGDAVGSQVRQLLAQSNDGSGIPIGTVTFATGILPFATRGQFGRWREGINPRYSAADDLSWTIRKHAFKMGFEYRRTESNGFNDPNVTPVALLGGGAQPANLDSTATGGAFPGLSTTNATLAKNILYDLTGSITNLQEAFPVLPNPANPTITDWRQVQNNRHWWYQNEMSSYFKDDWKLRPDLTLNLGIHWEYYGMPYEAHGLAARVVGNESTFLNVSCAGTPGVAGSNLNADGTPNCTNLATVQFVGKNSPNPNIGTYVNGNDLNNFAPAVGLAWNVPWFGKGKTVVRTGYGMTYQGALRSFILVDGAIGTVPGINLISGGTGQTYNPAAYTNMATFTLPIPKASGSAVAAPFLVPTTDRTLGLTTYKQVSPYTQNWNLEIQHEIAKNTTLEVRYVGTKGTKLWSGVDLNTLNWIKPQPALLAAFNAARSGQESPLLDQLLNGVALSGSPCGTVNGTTCTGATVFRSNSTTRGQIANGSYGAFLNSLNTSLQYTGGPSNQGSILRHAGFPDNYLVADPQYSAVTINGNNQNSTYHSLNLQLTRRLANGFTNTTTYIWSKSMGDVGTSPDPNNRHLTHTLQAVDHAHQISSSGTYELPFGGEHYLLGKAPGWMQNIVSHWQLGGVMNFSTGAPLTLTSGTNSITNTAAFPQLVGPRPKAQLTKVAGGITYFNGYTVVPDPGFGQASPNCTVSGSCNSLAAGLTNKAIQDPNGNIVLQNPQPGQLGNLGLSTYRGPHSLYFDMNMVKRFRITETKSFEFRVSAVNVLNHPVFAGPTASINSTSFGQITALAATGGVNTGGNGGMRSFVIDSRINF